MPKNKDENFQRFPTKGGFNGLGKDSSWQTTIFTVVAIVNEVLFFYVFSELGSKDAEGNFQLSTEVPSSSFYIFATITIAICAGSSFFICDKYPQLRWSAVFLPAGFRRQ